MLILYSLLHLYVILAIGVLIFTLFYDFFIFKE